MLSFDVAASRLICVRGFPNITAAPTNKIALSTTPIKNVTANTRQNSTRASRAWRAARAADSCSALRLVLPNRLLCSSAID